MSEIVITFVMFAVLYIGYRLGRFFEQTSDNPVRDKIESEIAGMERDLAKPDFAGDKEALYPVLASFKRLLRA